MPTRKVGSAAASGTFVTIVIGFLNATLFEGNEISGEVAAGITTALAFIVSYFVPDAEEPPPVTIKTPYDS